MKKIITLLLVVIFCLGKTTNIFAQVNLQDSLALVNLYDSTGGTDWYYKTGWLTGPVNTWQGITVTNNRVTSINLFYDNLTGPIPYTLGNLSQLTFLNLNLNNLNGTIPDALGNLSNATQINLAYNKLTANIPSTLGGINSLLILSLNNNQLSGPVPIFLKAGLPHFFQFNISENQLTFAGMEALASTFNFPLYTPQATIPLNYNEGLLSCSAGGTLANDTFHWYNGSTLLATNAGDSTFAVTAAGQYSVAVTNGIATQLTLYSDSINITTLPVSLTAFTAVKTGNTNLLQWSTAQEINSNYFEVDRSIDGINFTAIGKVTAKGNGGANKYSFNDNTIAALSFLPSTVYYRLKMVDKNAQFSYSGIRDISNKINFSASLYPNPAKGNVNVVINAVQNETAQIEIGNMDGKILFSKNISIAPGTSAQNIDVSFLSSGSYFVNIKTSEGKAILKLVKTN